MYVFFTLLKAIVYFHLQNGKYYGTTTHFLIEMTLQKMLQLYRAEAPPTNSTAPWGSESRRRARSRFLADGRGEHQRVTIGLPGNSLEITFLRLSESAWSPRNAVPMPGTKDAARASECQPGG